MTRRTALAAPLTAFAGCIVCSGALAATTLTYPGAAPCNTTLQACVTGASAGDTIELATNSLIVEFVTIDKSLTIEPAPGFTPSVQGLFAAVTTTDLSLTVQNLAGVQALRTVLAPGGGNLTLNVLNNVMGGLSSFNGAVEIDAGNGASGTYGTVTATVSGNHISQSGSPCTDAVSIVGVPASFNATVVGNDFTLSNLSQCGAVDAVVGAGGTGTVLIDRNVVHGTDFDYGLLVRNFGSNPGNPGGLLTAQVTNNLVWGQNGNTGAPAGLVVSADGNNAALNAQLVNNTVVDGRTGVLVSLRDDLGAVVTGGLFNNIVAFNSQTGITIDAAASFPNSNNLTFGNGGDFFTPGPQTITTDPLFTNRPAHDYTLTEASPAVNSGSDAALGASFTLDAAGNPRRVGPIDRGAFESAFLPPKATEAVPALDDVALVLLGLMLAGAAALRMRR